MAESPGSSTMRPMALELDGPLADRDQTNRPFPLQSLSVDRRDRRLSASLVAGTVHRATGRGSLRRTDSCARGRRGPSKSNHWGSRQNLSWATRRRSFPHPRGSSVRPHNAADRGSSPAPGKESAETAAVGVCWCMFRASIPEKSLANLQVVRCAKLRKLTTLAARIALPRHNGVQGVAGSNPAVPIS
jgi:hypothetical protein